MKRIVSILLILIMCLGMVSFVWADDKQQSGNGGGAKAGNASPTDVSHTHSYTVKETPSTCSKAGTRVSSCTCGDTQTETLPLLPHTWDTGKITKEATCAAEGVKTYTCSVCGTTKTESIPKLTTHKWDSGKVTTAASCVKKGVRTYTCTVCKTTKTESLGYGSHIWGDGSVEKDATITEPGTLVRKCDVCGKVRSEVISRLGLRMTPEELTTVVAEENNVLRIRLDDELYVIMQGVFTPEETECLQDGWPAEITLKAVDVTMDVPDQTLDELMERRDNLLSCFHLQLSKSVHTSADEVSETESLSTPANPLIMALDFPETMPQPDGKNERHYFLYSLEGDSTEKVAFQLKEDGSGIRFQTDKMDGTFILLFRDGNGGSFNPMVLVFGLVGLTALGGIGFLVKKVFFTYEEE